MRRHRTNTRTIALAAVAASTLGAFAGCVPGACACEPYDPVREETAAQWYSDLAEGRHHLAWERLDPTARTEFGDVDGLRAAADDWLPDQTELERGGRWLLLAEEERSDGAELALLVRTDGDQEADEPVALLASAAVVTPDDEAGTPEPEPAIAPLPDGGTLQLTVTDAPEDPPATTAHGPAVRVTDAHGDPVPATEVTFVQLSAPDSFGRVDVASEEESDAPVVLERARDETVLLVAARMVHDRWQYATLPLPPAEAT